MKSNEAADGHIRVTDMFIRAATRQTAMIGRKQVPALASRCLPGSRRLFAAGVCFILAGTAIGAGPNYLAPEPSGPGIFGIGFTDKADTSARLVFTTSEPMSTTVEVYDRAAKLQSLSQPSFDEIHAVMIGALSKQEEYRIVITAKGKAGDTASQETSLRPALRPASTHRWPGYTIFGSTTNGNNPENLAMLVQSGARMARVEISWDAVMPRRGQINHSYLDQMVTRIAEMKEHNIQPLVLLDYCVQWAKPYTDQTMTWRNVNFGPPDRLSDWKDYVTAVVTALHGAARYYEIWNEPDAGYLATGSFVERPNLPPPIGRPPFKDNWDYWIGDRYVPMIETAREVIGDLQPDALVMNGGWNRDYSGQRGEIMLMRGAGSYLDLYAYHVYSHSPTSFSRWYKEVDGEFRTNIDRIFEENAVRFPLAVTEWGTPAWAVPPEGKGFTTFADSQLFYVKSTFYFLSMERFEILSQFSVGVGPSTRDKDPTFFQLVNEDVPHHPIFTPTFYTFQWLANTFGSKAYRALPVKVAEAPQVKAYAIQIKDSGDIYLAAWQDGDVDDSGAITPLPARTVNASIAGLTPGRYRMTVLDVDGKAQSQTEVREGALTVIQAPLPAATATSESGVFLVKITPQP